MVSVIAQISDLHLGGPNHGSGARFSEAIEAINAMSRQPDLVLVTGDLTHVGAAGEWDEFLERIAALRTPWDAVRGNHDRRIDAHVGHRTVDLDELHVVLLDTSTDEFTDDDAYWLDDHLGRHSERSVAIALHHPPFETGIWWMDCVGLRGIERFEAVVRRHPHVRHVMSGHVHRPITTTWAGCLVTACPSTSVAVAGDLDPHHDPAETDEPPMIALHAYLDTTVVSHTVAVGAAAKRSPISVNAPDFVDLGPSRTLPTHEPVRHPDDPVATQDTSARVEGTPARSTHETSKTGIGLRRTVVLGADTSRTPGHSQEPWRPGGEPDPVTPGPSAHRRLAPPPNDQ